MFSRAKIAMVVAEILGTATLVVVVYSMVARTSFPFFAGIAAGLAVGLMTQIIGLASGVHLNPAVTIALWTIRKVKTLHAIIYLGAQAVGAALALLLLRYFVGGPLEELAQGNFEWKVFTAEAVGAFVFLFGLASAVYQRLEGGRFAAVVGGSLALGIMVASMASNGVVNPAVAAGIRSFNWAYVLGPIAGGIVGASTYAWLFAGDFPVIKLVRATKTSTKKVSARTTSKKTVSKKVATKNKRTPAKKTKR